MVPRSHRRALLMGATMLLLAIVLLWDGMSPPRRAATIIGLAAVVYCGARLLTRRNTRADDIRAYEQAFDKARRLRAEYARQQFPDILRPRSDPSRTHPHIATTLTPARAPRSSSSPASPSSPRLRIVPSPTPSEIASPPGAPPDAPQ